MKRLPASLGVAALLLGSSAQCAAACNDFSAERRAYFGDLHVHTRFSQDASWRMGNTRLGPDEAYQFARGHRIDLPPYDALGESLRSVQLQRPLDFLAVTDHAEALDAVRVCENPAYDGPGAWMCHSSPWTRMAMGLVGRYLPVDTLCGPGDVQCALAGAEVWSDIVLSAQQHNAPCDFSTFIGYEWSGLDGGANLHRNVIFRNSAVPAAPVSARDARTPEALWAALDEHCRDSIDGCEAVTIPHNANLSQGRMFSPMTTAGVRMTPALAAQRARYERLAELIQHKGDSECYGGVGAEDELCGFEKLPYSSFVQKYLPFLGEAPADDSRYLREALREGLRLQRELGENPFAIGFIGGTDSHVAAGGAVAEDNHPGHHGAQHISGTGAAAQLPDRVEQNPGGLAVLYAEENSRDALYRAMQRREAYATSGPRIQLRFFGGWNYEDDLCERVDLVAQGYANGVPMGGELRAADRNGRAPAFLLAAMADTGTASLPGGALQRLQVIKAWVDAQGESREQIYDVAGSVEIGMQVDLKSCQPLARGYRKLCTVWRDPEFSPATSALYYARVVETPSCRWHRRICVANAVNCDDVEALPDGFKGCCDESVPDTVQERAWSSPIWYRPASNEETR